MIHLFTTWIKIDWVGISQYLPNCRKCTMRLLIIVLSGFFAMNSISTACAFHRCNVARFSRATLRTHKTRKPVQSSPSTASSMRLYAATESNFSKSYTLNGKGLPGGTKVEATTNTGHSLATDIPKSMGGGNTAPQPVETLLGAWMGCTQATASFVGRQLLLEKAKLQPLTELTTGRRNRRPPRMEVLLEFDNIQAYRDEQGALELPIRQTPSVPSRLQRITGTIKVSLVPATGSTDEQTSEIVFDSEELEILKEQTESRCPIANMIVESGCAMDVEWIQE